MGKLRSDALVFFGATGDLAYKKIFPALQAMARRGKLDFPVVGVAKSSWTRAQLVERARASLTEHGGGVDPEAFAKLEAQLRYVDGDYNDAETFTRLRAELEGSHHPAHYLAIPPSMFPTVVSQPRRSDGDTRRTRDRREALRSRFGVGAGTESDSPQVLPGGGYLPNRPLSRQGSGPEHSLLPIRQRVSRTDLESPLHRERADHHGRGLRGEGARQVLRRDRGDPRRHPESPAPDCQLSGNGSAIVDLCRSDP